MCARIAMILAVLAALVGISPGAIIEYDFNQPASYTLAQVIDAGGIRVGDKVFTDWRVVTTGQNGGLPPEGIAIAVTGAFIGGEYGLQFNGGWSAGPGALVDTTIGFKVTADVPFLIHDNTLYATAFGAANGGVASISEQVYDADPQKDFLTPLANKWVWYISDTNFDNIDHKVFMKDKIPVAYQSVWIVKDIIANGGTLANGTAHISEFYQTFSQIPEPATLGLLAFGAVIILRRRRTA